MKQDEVTESVFWEKCNDLSYCFNQLHVLHDLFNDEIDNMQDSVVCNLTEDAMNKHLAKLNLLNDILGERIMQLDEKPAEEMKGK